MGAFSVIDAAAIVISIAAAAFSGFTWYCSILHDRKQATLEAYNQLQGQALDHLFLYKIDEIKEIAEDPKSERYKQIGFYIARIEHFCVGVDKKIYDRKTVYDLAHGFLDMSIKNRIAPILEKKARPEEEFYAYTKKLYANMEKEYKKRKRKQK